LEAQRLADSQDVKEPPNPSRDSAAGVAERKDPRIGHVHLLPSNEETTAACGEDVADPIDFTTVGESDEELITNPEDVYRGPVDPAARPAAVDDDAEAGQACGDWTDDRVGHSAI
jgi:hypothetical protein